MTTAISNKINEIANKIEESKDSINNEEMTKMALIMPFIQHVLGYDTSNPKEVTAEFTADFGGKKNEKVDYALLIDGKPHVLIECKKMSEKLSNKNASQLFRYFNASEDTKIGILTNGIEYHFFTDLDTPNMMDETPYMILNVTNVEEDLLTNLSMINKSNFNIDNLIPSASELKYVKLVKEEIKKQFNSPSEDMVKLLFKNIFNGTFTSNKKSEFTPITKKAMSFYIKELFQEGSNKVINDNEETKGVEKLPTIGIETTAEEVESYHIIKSIIRQNIDTGRITIKDTTNYCAIIVDNSSAKPIARLFFNTSNKYIKTFGEEEMKHSISNIDDIYNLSEILIATAKKYV